MPLAPTNEETGCIEDMINDIATACQSVQQQAGDERINLERAHRSKSASSKPFLRHKSSASLVVCVMTRGFMFSCSHSCSFCRANSISTAQSNFRARVLSSLPSALTFVRARVSLSFVQRNNQNHECIGDERGSGQCSGCNEQQQSTTVSRPPAAARFHSNETGTDCASFIRSTLFRGGCEKCGMGGGDRGTRQRRAG